MSIVFDSWVLEMDREYIKSQGKTNRTCSCQMRRYTTGGFRKAAYIQIAIALGEKMQHFVVKERLERVSEGELKCQKVIDSILSYTKDGQKVPRQTVKFLLRLSEKFFIFPRM